VSVAAVPGEDELVVARGLSRTYVMGGGVVVRALDGVDLTVKPGTFLAIMGPSGSGKSTLLNLIGCLDRPDGGELVIAGRRVSEEAPSALAAFRLTHIGVVFQRFNLLDHLTALENVELPLHYVRPRRPGTEARRRALEALEAVGLAPRAHHRPDQLSGGEQQRVGIARAVVNRPTLLLADEPTGELDTTTGDQVTELLHSQSRVAGRAVIVVTHDERVAARADRLVRLVDGRVAAG
jgi:ABC-type lipoprotein export system ATPase subunit